MSIKVGLIGKGVVGTALHDGFLSRDQKVSVYDKYKEIGSLDQLYDSDILFVCLPTLLSKGSGYDISAIQEVCFKLKENNFSGVLVLKSTVQPGTTDSLINETGLNIVHNPEFLTARTALKDFNNQKQIVLGGKYSRVLYNFYYTMYPNTDISTCSSKESEMMKLFSNSFYAMKVQIFTEFFLLCKNQNVDYDTVKEIMLDNDWINPMHTEIPGPDKDISYGGMCFPKDTNALYHFMKEAETPCEVLEACINERNKMRDSE